MKVMSAGGYAWRVGLCGVCLAGLLVLSPGIGVTSASFGWVDAWRARLGLPIATEELADRPLVDVDGDGQVSAAELTDYADVARYIGFELRFARSLLALQVGITLALCGATFQTLFRNPLATPYTLGIASGGALGALIAIKAGWELSVWGVSSTALCAFVGGLGVVGAVLWLARGARGLTSNEMLLAGVTMGLFCSAMMMVVTVLADERQVFEVIRWMMGSLDAISTTRSAMLWPFILPAWVVLIVSARALDQYRLGDELATTRGVNVRRLQIGCVLVATLAVAAVAAVCGPIGFVGLVVPHIAALLFGSDRRVVLPASALLGGAFLIVCDWGAQLAMTAAGAVTGRELGGTVLPVGVVTAAVGVPVFLVLLRARRGRGGQSPPYGR
ncbi:MAG TPA: iron ABC transporter permease [Phycisphaerae bacterium]|nr:iron ABC transporter permease [Phycisphaerae bacterium]HNU45227.1 iron ABC transporter permease [Phycisphaerae bacterium]